jgi:hypothetical protein
MRTEITDGQREKAVESMLQKTEIQLGMPIGTELPIGERAFRILDRAKGRSLEIRLYQLAWFIWKHSPIAV